MKLRFRIISALMILTCLFSMPVSAAFSQVKWENWGTSSVILYDDMSIIVETANGIVEPEEEVVTNDYKKLKQIGIVVGNEYDTPADGKSITRAGFVQMAARALKLDTVSDFDQVFIDVPKTHFAFNEISAAVNYGIISGYNGYFNEADPITYTDAAVILVNMLGHSQEAKVKGDYTAGYMAAANRYKIFDGVNLTDASLAANPNDLYRMIVNTIQSYDYANFNSVVDGDVKYSKGESILEIYHKIYIAEGIVNAVGQSNMLSNNEYASDEVLIGNTIFKGDYERYIDFLGMYVELLYREVSTTTKELVFVEATENNRILILDASEIEDYQNNTYTYTSDTKEKKAKVISGAPIVYNGKINTNGININDVYKPDFGYVKLISNNGTSTYNVVIVNSIEDMIVGTVVDETGTVYDYVDRSKSVVLDLENEDIMVSLKKEGDIDFYPSMLAEKDILSIISSADGKIIKAVQSSGTLAGKITGIENDGDGAIITINDKQYVVTKDCNTRFSKALKVGNDVTLHFNAYGNVAYVEQGISTGSSLSYGYIIELFDNDPKERDSVFVKILSQDGTINEFYIPEKVKIDGKRYSKKSDVVTALKLGLTKYNTGEETDIGVIKYSASEEGLIKEIDTPYVNNSLEDETSSLRLIYDKNLFDTDYADGNLIDSEINQKGLAHKNTTNGGVFSESIYWTFDRTVLFRINTTASNETDKYRVETKITPFKNDVYYKSTPVNEIPEFYSSTDGYYADAIVHFDTVSSGQVASMDVYVVKEIKQAILNDEELTMLVVTNTGSDDKKLYIDASRLAGKDIDIGDLIIFDETNNKVMGSSIQKIYDYETGVKYGWDSTANSGNGAYVTGFKDWYNAEFRTIIGYVYDVKEGLTTIYDATDVNDLALADTNRLIGNPKVIVSNFSGRNIVKVTKNVKGEIEVTGASALNLKPYLGCGNEATKVFVRYMYTGPQQAFIFE